MTSATAHISRDIAGAMGQSSTSCRWLAQTPVDSVKVDDINARTEEAQVIADTWSGVAGAKETPSGQFIEGSLGAENPAIIVDFKIFTPELYCAIL